MSAMIVKRLIINSYAHSDTYAMLFIANKAQTENYNLKLKPNTLCTDYKIILALLLLLHVTPVAIIDCYAKNCYEFTKHCN